MDNMFGDYLTNVMEQKNTAAQDLCAGICNHTYIQRICTGKIIATKVLKDRLLERLGVINGDYEAFVSDAEYTGVKVRKDIVRNIEKRDFDKAEELIKFYESSPLGVKKASTDEIIKRQYCMDMRLMIYKLQTDADLRTDPEYIRRLEEALSLTLPKERPEGFGKAVFSPKEVNLLLEYSMTRTFTDGLVTLEMLLKYFDERDIDIQFRAMIYPKVVYYYARMLQILPYDFTRQNEKTMKLIEKAMDCLIEAQRFFYMYELLEVKEELYKRVLKTGDESAAEHIYRIGRYKYALEWLSKEFGTPLRTDDWGYLYYETGIINVRTAIKKRRKMLGMSVFELAKDICTDKTIRRIEGNADYNCSEGEVLREIFRKLKLTSEMYRTEIDTNDVQVRELEKKVKELSREHKYDEALAILKKMQNSMLNTPENMQFLLRNEGSIKNAMNRGSKEAEELILKAAACTIPENVKMDKGLFLTRGEIMCAHNMAMVKAFSDPDGCLKALEAVFDFVENSSDDVMIETPRIREMFFDIKRLLFMLKGRDDEAIDVCNEAILHLVHERSVMNLSLFIYSIWQIRRGRKEEFLLEKECIEECLTLCDMYKMDVYEKEYRRAYNKAYEKK